LEPLAIIIPIVSVFIPFIIMFTTRGLNKGEKDRNHIKDEMDALAKEVSTNSRNFAILEERLRNHINGSKEK
jgi:hypothetical protein